MGATFSVYLLRLRRSAEQAALLSELRVSRAIRIRAGEDGVLAAKGHPGT